jgi:hypothetical protein
LLVRTPDPLPGLQAGPYELSLARVTLPPGMPAARSHFRSGAALNYVLAGRGPFTAEGKTEGRTPGTADFELNGLVYQWAKIRRYPSRPAAGEPQSGGHAGGRSGKHKIAAEAMERSLGAKLLPLITG